MLNSRVKGANIMDKNFDTKSLINKKIKEKNDLLKLQSSKIVTIKGLRLLNSRKSSKPITENRNSGVTSSTKDKIATETKLISQENVSSKVNKTRNAAELYLNNEQSRVLLNISKDNQRSLLIVKKPPLKFKNPIGQSSTLKNLIRNQLQQNNDSIPRSNVTNKISTFNTVVKKLVSNVNNAQKIQTNKFKYSNNKSKNEKQHCKKHSFDAESSYVSKQTFSVEKQSSTVTLLKSYLSKVKVSNNGKKVDRDIVNIREPDKQESTLVLMQNSTISLKHNKSGYLETSALYCNEPMVPNRFHLSTEIGLNINDVYEQSEMFLITEDENDAADFKHDVFENLYNNETINYLTTQEEIYRIHPEYLVLYQNNISSRMRTVLLDWMQEVCSDYLFKRETFHYAVNYVDRYLSVIPNIEVNKLQLVGLSSLFLAAKNEEVYTPKIESIITAANNSYSETHLQQMEINLFKVR